MLGRLTVIAENYHGQCFQVCNNYEICSFFFLNTKIAIFLNKTFSRSEFDVGLPKEPFPGRPRKDEATLRGSNDARSFNRQNSKTASQNVRKSNQTCSLSPILPHLRLLLKKKKTSEGAREVERSDCGVLRAYISGNRQRW